MRKLSEARRRKLELRSRGLLSFDSSYGINISGMDEVGRGCLFGPVYACCANVGWSEDLIEVYDSKSMSYEKRSYLYELIMRNVNYYGIGFVDNTYIDEYGINPAIKTAMQKAAQNADIMARERSSALGFVLVDYVAFELAGFCYEKIKKGDAMSFQIACASIIAKVKRDEHITSLSAEYPGYDLENNKGYGTPKHMEGLQKYGPSPLHRLTFI